MRTSAFPLMYSFPFLDVRYGENTKSPSCTMFAVHYKHEGRPDHDVTYHSNDEGKWGGICSSVNDIDIYATIQCEICTIRHDIDSRRLDHMCHNFKFHGGILLLQLCIQDKVIWEWKTSDYCHMMNLARVYFWYEECKALGVQMEK